MPIQPGRQITFAFVTTVMFVLGAAPVPADAAAGKRGASAIAALDAIPAEDWLKQSSGALLDRVIAASSKESLDAAATRDPRAQALVGSAHLAGLHGYAKSEAEAVKFYRLAATSNPVAQNNLGSLLLTGVANGGKPAPSEAAEMFRRAAKLGHPVAQANLGKLYADGVGVEKDPAKAKEYLTLAAAQGNTDAKNFLDVLAAREAADADAAKRKRLEAAAATGDADARRELAAAYAATEKKVFDAIKNNQLQAAVNTILDAPDGKQVDVAKLTDEHGMTALHWAAANRNAAAMRWLLDKDAELESKDDQGRTPLKIALDTRDVNTMTLLVARGARTSTALPGYDDELKVLKKNSDIVNFMLSPKRCAAGDAALCHSIGLAYDNGTEGFSVNRRLAAGYYEKACDRGVAAACTNLGLLHLNGEGVAKDESRATALFDKSCAAGNAQACSLLGGQYLMGRGTAKDVTKSIAYYNKACDAGWANACSVLAAFYTEGKSVPRDDAKAAINHTKACDGGILESCAQLGYAYRNGIGVVQDYAKAASLYGKACSPKLPIACFNLGLMHQQGEGMPQDHAKALALFQDACAADYAYSCMYLGSRHLAGKGMPENRPKAAELFEKACAGNDAAGCYLLALMLADGDGVAADKARAATLFAKACEGGEKRACDRQAGKAAVSAAPAKAPAAAPATRTPAGAACKVARVQLGVDTVASVERDIKARGGEPSAGGSGLAQYKVATLSGDYSDIGANVAAVNYDFDAAGPAGRLVAVTLVHHAYPGPVFENVLASRKAVATAITGPLQQKSAKELVASGPACQLRLLPDADTSYIYEVYQLAN